jgi:hypothetical protein
MQARNVPVNDGEGEELLDVSDEDTDEDDDKGGDKDVEDDEEDDEEDEDVKEKREEFIAPNPL